MTFKLDMKQRRALEGIAYWQAEIYYLNERDRNSVHEIEEARKTIECNLDEADRLGIPYWVQNVALDFARDWRRTLRMYLSQWLEKNGITC